MQQTTFAALAAFALVSSITPGPNNMMLMASGANFGLRPARDMAVMRASICDAQVVLASATPSLETWANAEAGKYARIDLTSRFGQAVLFQWVNPKAWSMALTAIALYAPDRNVAAVLLVAAIFGIINLPSTSLWAVMGVSLRGWLSSPARLRAFNWTMAALLVGSLALLI